MAGAADDESDIAFGVLGPLRVMRGGVAVPLGGRQQRAVLARLLLADGGGLSVDQLADALWGERVPAGAASTIQTYVFHLRQVLEPDRERGGRGRMVITDNGRYRLAVPVGALDATSFERHLVAGHRLLADGSPADALTELDQALYLWRGDVLADLAERSRPTSAANCSSCGETRTFISGRTQLNRLGTQTSSDMSRAMLAEPGRMSSLGEPTSATSPLTFPRRRRSFGSTAARCTASRG